VEDLDPHLAALVHPRDRGGGAIAAHVDPDPDRLSVPELGLARDRLPGAGREPVPGALDPLIRVEAPEGELGDGLPLLGEVLGRDPARRLTALTAFASSISTSSGSDHSSIRMFGPRASVKPPCRFTFGCASARP
jgi:hypothetical protein